MSRSRVACLDLFAHEVAPLVGQFGRLGAPLLRMRETAAGVSYQVGANVPAEPGDTQGVDEGPAFGSGSGPIPMTAPLAM